MTVQSRRLKRDTQLYLLAGIAFGFCFPFLAWYIDLMFVGLPLSFASIKWIH